MAFPEWCPLVGVGVGNITSVVAYVDVASKSQSLINDIHDKTKIGSEKMSWNAEVYTISVGEGVEVSFEEEITAEDIRKVARDNGIKNLGVKNTAGAELDPEDFPVKENIVIFQVNKAGS
jgi:hypothetical protein